VGADLRQLRALSGKRNYRVYRNTKFLSDKESDDEKYLLPPMPWWRFWLPWTFSWFMRALLLAGVAFQLFWYRKSIIHIAREYEALAAWVEAIGVFAAVYLSGAISRGHAARIQRAERRRLVASTCAVIWRAREAAKQLYALKEPIAGFRGEDPRYSIEVASEALTPKSILELPDKSLVSMTLMVSASLAALRRWITNNATIFDPGSGYFDGKPVDALQQVALPVITNSMAFLGLAEGPTSVWKEKPELPRAYDSTKVIKRMRDFIQGR